MKQVPITVIILTLNEELNIDTCLKSIYKWSDDIFILDSYSKDKTIEISKKYVNNIISVDQNHWSSIRNWALRNLPIKYDWVLFLDADERLTYELKTEIEEVTQDNSDINGYYINRRFIFLGRWLKHGGLYTKILRLFRYKFTYYIADGDVEYAIVKGKSSYLKNDIIHEDKKGIFNWIEKHNKISERAAIQFNKKHDILLTTKNKEIEVEGGKLTYFKYKLWDKIPLILRPIITFFYQYVIMLGFLDGIEGLTYHFLQAFWYRVLIYVKVKELQYYKSFK
ncbi:MAG: glycosyltransferase family 2 protein [Candidatus Bathyarchaeia archaeon]